MATATYIDIAKSTIAAATTSPTKAIQNDEAACYLYFTPIPGTPSIGTHDDINNKNNMHAACNNALLPQNKMMTTPPTVPLGVALAAAHPDGSFDMEELGVVVSELGTHDELCIQNIFERRVPFVLAPRVRKGKGDGDSIVW